MTIISHNYKRPKSQLQGFEALIIIYQAFKSEYSQTQNQMRRHNGVVD